MRKNPFSKGTSTASNEGMEKRTNRAAPEAGVSIDRRFDSLMGNQATAFEEPQRRATNNHPNQDDEIHSIMNDSEEEVLLRRRRAEGKTYASRTGEGKESIRRDHSGEALIEGSRKKFSGHKGIKSARYITSDILMSLSPDFLDRYHDAVLDSAEKILNKIISDENNDIAEAQLNPTDEALQDKAYKTLYAGMYSHLQSNHKDLNKPVLMGLIVNEILGFGPLDPLWRDRKIDEILCNGPYDVQVEIKGQIYKVPAARFRDRAHMYSLLEKLYGSINKSVSQMTPIVDGRLHDNSRMSVVHHIAAPAGPNYSIRRHPEEYITPDKIIGYGSATQEMMTDLGNWMNKGCSILVVGGTGTGKTTTLNALSGFFPERERVITMEDNIELMMNPNKLLAAAMETVSPKPDRPDDAGVTMRDLLKASLRLRPDGIVLGEVRDAAAYDLIQALNTGHWGVSTVHAESAPEAVDRLASLSAQSGLTTTQAELKMIASAFDIIVVLKRYADGTRKIVSVEEVGIKPELGKDNAIYLPTYPLWKFIEQENRDATDLTVRGHWQKVAEISDIRKERKSLNLTPNKDWEGLSELFRIKR